MSCANYTGAACTDGTCPIALSEKYEDYGIPIPVDCNECSNYKGCCEDCIWNGTDICDLEGDRNGSA
jgi:hypothetical protein